MERIGIDIRMATRTGIGRYIRGLVAGLSSNKRFTYSFVGGKSDREFVSESSFVETKTGVYGLMEQLTIPYLMRGHSCLHVPHYNAPLFWPKKLVVTIHDLIHLHYQSHLRSPFARVYAKVMLPLMVRRADAIIAVSEYTKEDLIKTLGVKREKISVIYHGIHPEFLCDNPFAGTTYETREQEPYFLYVGLLKTHKNVGVLLEAFRTLKKKVKVKDLKLRLVGTPDTKQPTVRHWLKIISESSDIILESGINDKLLVKRYQKAIALVYPSRYEGFGFPLIEAMASDIPIIASRATSIPEVVGGEAALLFDPNSSGELSQHMKRVIESADLRQKLINNGKMRRRRFTWENVARHTEKVYEAVLGNS